LSDSPVRRDLLDSALAGHDAAFAELVEPHRRSVFRHCYRMLGSGVDAEDATQETMERAWRRLHTYDASGRFGGWLHRIATNICLDALRARPARRDPMGEGVASSSNVISLVPDLESRWVEPVGDAELGLSDPQDEVVRREDVRLAFLAALQRLAPRQRAALLLHDVLGFSHTEVSQTLEISPSAVNSLLSRARDGAPVRASASYDPADRRLRALLERYVRAWQRADIGALVELVADDVRLSMPPLDAWFAGRASVAGFLEQAVFAAARPHGVPLRGGWCNGQPAFATYEPGPDGGLHASGLQVLDLEGDEVTAIVSYRDPELPRRCGFPAVIVRD
jgi:RNA polymerase sigma-70 factor (ECF subfamily)